MVPTLRVGIQDGTLQRPEPQSGSDCIPTQSVGTIKRCMAGIAMHELSLCESILQVLEQQAEIQQYKKVKTVWLEIGALSNVEIEALRFSFDVVVHGSIAENARLEIIEIPGQAWCMPCSRNVIVQQLYDLCPHCGSHQLQVNSGDQMRIKELEVE